MCDTQLIKQNGITYFAKNSDRESSEPQLICRFDGVIGDKQSKLQTTYLNIPQVSDRHGLILSKPSWIWGAEIGINTKGVVIGNEAVFTRMVERKKSTLLGMDLVRLGLERGASAQEALNTIANLLERYGQGGSAGFRDKSFRYDNSFIIADAEESWILETAGQHWVAKKIHDYAAISNVLSIESDYDLSSKGLEDFARSKGFCKKHLTFSFAQAFNTCFMPFMGKARARQHSSLCRLKNLHEDKTASLSAMITNLRHHRHNPGSEYSKSSQNERFARGSNHDICMHGAGLTRPSQTCGSMVAALSSKQGVVKQAETQIMLTGTSAPCLSLFKPVSFGFEASSSMEYTSQMTEHESLWYQYEWVHRRALKDMVFYQELIASRNALESKLMAVYTEKLSLAEANKLAKEWHESWHQKAKKLKAPLHYSILNAYDRYWRKLNRLDDIQWT